MNYRLASYSTDQCDVFWFERNPLGDIVAVYDDLGTKLISYTYDAWGNATISYATGINSYNHDDNAYIWENIIHGIVKGLENWYYDYW